MSINDFDDFDQPLRSAGGNRFPTVKFEEVGQQFVGMVIDYDDKAPLFIYGTQQRATTDDGKEKTKDVVTLLLMAGTTCPVSDPDGKDEGATLANVEGVVAKLHIQGHNRWTPDARPDGMKPAWRNALDAFGDFRRGCVVRGRFESTSRVGSNGARLSQDKKLIGFDVRAAKHEEQPLIEQCKAEYWALKEAKAAARWRPRTPDYVRTGAPVPASDEF